MLRHALTPCLTIACALLVAVGLPSASWPMDMSDAETPKVAFERFITAFNALDWRTFRACFTDEASVFNPVIPEVVSLHRLDGRESIENTFRAVFDASSKGAPVRISFRRECVFSASMTPRSSHLSSDAPWILLDGVQLCYTGRVRVG